MLKRILLATIASFPVVASAGQVATDLTPQQMQDALAAGGPPCYKLEAKASGGGMGIGVGKTPVGCFSTPYSRVAGAASEAKRKYKTIAATEITPEMVAPGQLQIHGFALANKRGGGVSSVESIVIMPKGSKERAKAIQPDHTEETTSEWTNAMGASAEGRSLTASFPLKYLSEDYEVHIIYDKKHVCDDCKAEFGLKEVR